MIIYASLRTDRKGGKIWLSLESLRILPTTGILVRPTTRSTSRQFAGWTGCRHRDSAFYQTGRKKGRRPGPTTTGQVKGRANEDECPKSTCQLPHDNEDRGDHRTPEYWIREGFGCMGWFKPHFHEPLRDPSLNFKQDIRPHPEILHLLRWN